MSRIQSWVWSPKEGSGDPDPNQNATDPQQWSELTGPDKDPEHRFPTVCYRTQ